MTTGQVWLVTEDPLCCCWVAKAWQLSLAEPMMVLQQQQQGVQQLLLLVALV
jgi:hypothetical protein